MLCSIEYGTVRYGVKLLLKCLQSIQCQYYLVFGVVKTVPLQSFKNCMSRSVYFPINSPHSNLPGPNHGLLRHLGSLLRYYVTSNQARQLDNAQLNGSTTWRTVIVHIYCIYSVYVVPLFIPCVHASSFHFDKRMHILYATCDTFDSLRNIIVTQ